MGDVLVFAEHQHGKFPKTTLVGFAAGKDAAAKFGGACHAVAYTAALAELVKAKGIDTIVATATAIGKDLTPRLAARLNAPLAADISGINADGTVQRSEE